MLANFRLAAAAALLTVVPSVFAQTFTDCDPLLKECPSDPALGTFASFNWTKEAADAKVWNVTAQPIDFSLDGAQFTISRKGEGPTIASNFYIFWGRVSVVMKAASGVGVVSSIVLESADRDEIDWEWLGGNSTHVQTNFFGKADTSSYNRDVWHPIDNALAEHNYTTVWTQEKTEFYIDDNLVRTLTFDDPKAKNTTVGDRYPQTPMQVKIGNWVPMENATGTVEWAGGLADWSKAPFVQLVRSVEVQDFTNGKEYTYGDRSGSWQSIQVTPGNSTVADYLSKPRGVNGRFNALSQGVKIGIIIAAISVAAILVLLIAFCCIKNRRAGRKEKAIADAEWERNVNELQQYKRMMVAEEEIHPRVKGGYI
ncbi:extracellular glycosidase-like protein 2 [Elsinoe australis]|uniref:chitinase n=1 Tax=Elsinoe australis TaxID=40998 RepID=A0A4U7ATM0_9PEZI|nr:extracellular glycosidase-like protein 2 [Elsinoe australis]